MKWLCVTLCVLSVMCGGALALAGQDVKDLPRVKNKLGMEFVLIPAGTFNMGSPTNEKYRDEDELIHSVTISQPFYMQTTEVTQKQWTAVMGDNPSAADWRGGQSPVERVSWNDCQDFINKLNKMGVGQYRLPTEAEWEYACRAGTVTPYWFGDTLDCSQAMFGNNTYKGPTNCVDYVEKKGWETDAPAPVKSFPPNGWGLYDMHGNVWEWCQDWYGKYEVGPVTDPTGPEKGHERVRRGGSFFKYPWYLRSANRNIAHPQSRYHTTGFRLVKEVDASGK